MPTSFAGKSFRFGNSCLSIQRVSGNSHFRVTGSKHSATFWDRPPPASPPNTSASTNFPLRPQPAQRKPSLAPQLCNLILTALFWGTRTPHPHQGVRCPSYTLHLAEGLRAAACRKWKLQLLHLANDINICLQPTPKYMQDR